ncbi:hypothetical protein [Streptomonospora sediminis]
MEGPVLNAVDLLVPGVSMLTHYVRYYALYAALAAHTHRHDLGAERCKQLLRRSETVLAAASEVQDDAGAWPGYAHGADRVRGVLGPDGLDIARVAGDGPAQQVYSPRPWGFWEDYRGPSAALGTAVMKEGALHPGRHACPQPVGDLFAPLFAAAENDWLSRTQLRELRPVTIQAEQTPEILWLAELFAACRSGRHDPEEWEPVGRRRRAALRILARTAILHPAEAAQNWEEAVRSAVVFGEGAEMDLVLRDIDEVWAWRGMLLRHYSVGAWRRLWAALVRRIGAEGEDADASHQELRDWLAEQMPAMTVRQCMAELPGTLADGHPAPAERQVLARDEARTPLTNVRLLLLGSQRVEELDGQARKIFLGAQQRQFLNPLWVARCVRELEDQSMRDFACRLIDDMLAQARRVALTKMRPGAPGTMVVFSRVHERNGRYYKTSNEGDSDLGTRIGQLAGIATQLGLVEQGHNDETGLTPLGTNLLAVGP